MLPRLLIQLEGFITTHSITIWYDLEWNRLVKEIKSQISRAFVNSFTIDISHYTLSTCTLFYIHMRYYKFAYTLFYIHVVPQHPAKIPKLSPVPLLLVSLLQSNGAPASSSKYIVTSFFFFFAFFAFTFFFPLLLPKSNKHKVSHVYIGNQTHTIMHMDITMNWKIN